jgi:hypothetical protein
VDSQGEEDVTLERANHWIFRCSGFPDHPARGTFPPGYEGEFAPFTYSQALLVQWLAKLNHQQRRVCFGADLALYHALAGIADTPHRRQLQALAWNHHATVRHPQWDDLFLEPRGLDRIPAPPDADRYGVGTTAPVVWVLGERANPAVRTFPLPFGTQAGTAMLWPEIPAAFVRVSNALQPDETPLQARRRLPRDWETLGRPLVLCVGRTAAALIHSVRDAVIMGAVDHVQYVWRFHHDAREEWSQTFRDLIWDALRGRTEVAG